jgi:hypothetical protein
MFAFIIVMAKWAFCTALNKMFARFTYCVPAFFAAELIKIIHLAASAVSVFFIA